MARMAVSYRRKQIGQAALQAFSESGFKRTQVADIARIAVTAPGTLYLYAPSKEVLFLMAMETALGEEPAEYADEKDILQTVHELILKVSNRPIFGLVDKGESTPFESPETILGLLWNSTERLSASIRLIERCAQDWPDLAAMFYEKLRAGLLQDLASYLRKGAELGVIRQVPNFELAARLIVETIAWFTIHRLGDRDGKFYDAVDSRTTTLDALIHAYVLQPMEVVS